MTFLDTGFLFVLVSKSNAHHSRVVEVFRTFRDLRLINHLLTTNHVIAETITLTRKIGHEDAARLGDLLSSCAFGTDTRSCRRSAVIRRASPAR